MLLSYQWITETLLVAMRLGETPVYIPNTQVKPEAADGTMLETAWESRWLPDFIRSFTVNSGFTFTENIYSKVMM